MTEISPDLVAFVREQKDRFDIEQCLLRYTRGVDRHDRELMLSAYWPDAFDEHGVAEGVAGDFVDWAIGWHGEYQNKHQHIIANHRCDIDGTVAHGETYYIFWGENRAGPPTLAFGRYIDRYEKRDGEWRIAHRVCVNEQSGHFIPAELSAEAERMLYKSGPNRRDRGDISYVRPLVRDRASEPA